jgi:hypothetical protein
MWALARSVGRVLTELGRELILAAQEAETERLTPPLGPASARQQEHEAVVAFLLAEAKETPTPARRDGLAAAADAIKAGAHRWRDMRDAGGRVSPDRMAELDAKAKADAKVLADLEELKPLMARLSWVAPEAFTAEERRQVRRYYELKGMPMGPEAERIFDRLDQRDQAEGVGTDIPETAQTVLHWRSGSGQSGRQVLTEAEAKAWSDLRSKAPATVMHFSRVGALLCGEPLWADQGSTDDPSKVNCPVCLTKLDEPDPAQAPSTNGTGPVPLFIDGDEDPEDETVEEEAERECDPLELSGQEAIAREKARALPRIIAVVHATGAEPAAALEAEARRLNEQERRGG